jgi:hypothetical protein
LINAPFSRSDVADLDMETLSCIIDYGWLSDANRAELQLSLNTPALGGFANWSVFDEPIGNEFNQSFDFIGNCMNSMLNRSGRETGW